MPKGWERFARLLTLAPDIFWVGAVLDGVTDGSVMDRASVMHRVLHAAPEQRRQLLGQTAFAPYIAADRPPTHAWREDLRRAIPEIPTGERRPLARLLVCLDDYFARLDDEFKRIAADPDSAHSSGDSAPGAWTHHRNLERRLRLLLAGDPFHPALILIYLLLEFLAMEKLRALMLARLRGWPAPDALTAAH